MQKLDVTQQLLQFPPALKMYLEHFDGQNDKLKDIKKILVNNRDRKYKSSGMLT